MSANDMLKRVEAVAGSVEREANALLSQERFKDARLVLQNAERDVRDVKRAATETQRNLRQEGTDARNSTNKSGQMIGLVAGSKARGHMARGRAMQKRKITDKVNDAVRPYDAVKTTCDNVLASLARAKAQVAQEEQNAKVSGQPAQASPEPAQAASPAPTPPPPPVPVATPATWAADPYGRHELRYWDGTAWSQHVSNQGVTSTDQPG